MAQQVRDTGTEVITEPLPAAERRVIHRTLSELPDITTQALGDGLIKRVWIGPQGGQPPAAESETAREQETPEPRFVREERETIAERAAMAEGAEEPLSLIDPWNAPAKPGAEGGGTVEEWGRRPKPARGRRR
jgi:hypothetical protein